MSCLFPSWLPPRSGVEGRGRAGLEEPKHDERTAAAVVPEPRCPGARKAADRSAVSGRDLCSLAELYPVIALLAVLLTVVLVGVASWFSETAPITAELRTAPESPGYSSPTSSMGPAVSSSEPSCRRAWRQDRRRLERR